MKNPNQDAFIPPQSKTMGAGFSSKKLKELAVLALCGYEWRAEAHKLPALSVSKQDICASWTPYSVKDFTHIDV